MAHSSRPTTKTVSHARWLWALTASHAPTKPLVPAATTELSYSVASVSANVPTAFTFQIASFASHANLDASHVPLPPIAHYVMRDFSCCQLMSVIWLHCHVLTHARLDILRPWMPRAPCVRRSASHATSTRAFHVLPEGCYSKDNAWLPVPPTILPWTASVWSAIQSARLAPSAPPPALHATLASFTNRPPRPAWKTALLSTSITTHWLTPARTARATAKPVTVLGTISVSPVKTHCLSKTVCALSNVQPTSTATPTASAKTATSPNA